MTNCWISGRHGQIVPSRVVVAADPERVHAHCQVPVLQVKDMKPMAVHAILMHVQHVSGLAIL